MMKRVVGFLLLANLALFSWMRWGSALTVDVDAVSVQAPLNPDKIRLQDLSLVSAVVPARSVVPSVAVPPASMPVDAESAVAAVPAPTVSVKVAPKALSCAEWGEFSGDDLARAQRALTEMKLGDKLAQRTVEHSHGYWVYIPPLKNRAEVERKISQLKVRGVDDYFVVQEEGEWLNAISLGVFRTEEAAQKYFAVLRTKGVRTARVGERMSKLKFIVFAMKDLDAAPVARLYALQKEFPGSEFKVSACGN